MEDDDRVNNRLAIVALTGLLVGTIIGGIWLSQDLPQVTPVATVASRATGPDDKGARASKGKKGTELGAGTASRPKARLDAARDEGPNAGSRPRDAQGEPSDDEPRRSPLGDTGLPSAASVLGLPADGEDDPDLVSGLADDYPPLPDRPLSNFELETLEDRAAWLSQTCDGSGDPSCAAAMENMDQALQQARSVRASAGVDGDQDIAPPPKLPPPLEDQPPPPEKGPPLDEDGQPLPPPPEGQEGPPPRPGQEPGDDFNR